MARIFLTFEFDVSGCIFQMRRKLRILSQFATLRSTTKGLRLAFYHFFNV